MDDTQRDTAHAALRATAQRLHDRVVPAATAAGLRVELARTLLADGKSAEADAHLQHAVTVLATLATELRAEMDRLHGS